MPTEPDHYVEFGDARDGSARVRGARVDTAHSDGEPRYFDALQEDGSSDGGIYEDDDEADGHPIFSANCEPILPPFLRSFRRDDPDVRLVYTSPVSYHGWNVFLFAIIPLSTVLSMAVVYSDRTVTRQIKTRDMVTLWVASVSIVLLLFLLLPRRVDLYSNSVVVVVTYLCSQEFSDVVAAYDDPATVPESWHHPRIKCTTNFVSRVLLRRKNGGWDVVVSPQDPKGLIDSVFQVAQAREATTMQAQVYTI
jgi:hypothetical protein